LSSDNGVAVTGYVPDTREYLSKETVVVVPLRIARGSQDKILEAMAMGLSVGATPEAFEGINATPNKDLMVEGNPGDFSQAVIRLLHNPTLRDELRNNARCKIGANYSWPRNLTKINEILSITSQSPESETGSSP
jgi:glycosyltransferase involved in cell wall biosynthesis